MNVLTLILQAAPAAGSQQGGGMSMIIMLVLLFGIMYLFMIRPQRKQQKEQEKFRAALAKGDKVVTIGGLHGTVAEVREHTVLLTVDDGVRIEVEKAALQAAVAPAPRK